VTESYYDWELGKRTKPAHMKKKKGKKDGLGISGEDFKRFIKLWKSKNIVF
jgi:hypothetical protein